MSELLNPKYPVYVISKGRSSCCLTADILVKDVTPFRLVVEPQEKHLYAEKYGEERLLVLPFSNLGLGSIPARNWVWEHSISEGFEKHWILDDNMRRFYRRYQAKKIPCRAGLALRMCEDFFDRYENVGIAGLNYEFFCIENKKMPPFFLNAHVYSCICILNKLPFRWRGRYNEDTDLCLQALSQDWCTMLVNAFSVAKMQTMAMKGGNTDELYKGDGRLKMARSLERMWPGIVKVVRRFKRPQHFVNWNIFTTMPIRKKEFQSIDENIGKIKLKQLKEIKSHQIKKLADQYNEKSQK